MLDILLRMDLLVRSTRVSVELGCRMILACVFVVPLDFGFKCCLEFPTSYVCSCSFCLKSLWIAYVMGYLFDSVGTQIFYP